ncbi:MAG: hypothetical protein ABSG64_03560 [Solirubrobacteraceae bacterium]|jgi:hypothetical protein
MPKRSGVVHIYEEEEASFDSERARPDGSYLCATFGGRWTRWPRDADGPSFDRLSLDKALAWGRSRAPEVQIRYGRADYHSAGDVNPSGLPEWPPEDLPTPLRRRRPPEQSWRERSETDPPVPWRLEVLLEPPNPSHMRTTARWEADRFIAATASEAGAIRWDAEPLDAHIYEQDEATPNIGLATLSPPAYRLHLEIVASTATAAEQRAEARVPKLPDGWRVQATAFPGA